MRARRASLALACVLAAGCGGGGGGSDGGTADGGPAFAPTFENVQQHVFKIGCALESCHASDTARTAGGLDLQANPYLALLGPDGKGAVAQDPAGYPYTYNGMRLVVPGDPGHSLLYLKITAASSCKGGSGAEAPPQSQCPDGLQMPNVAGTSLDPGTIEAVRAWIADGAPGPADAGVTEGGGSDAGADAGAQDAGAVDAGNPDAGPGDAGLADAGGGDGGTVDAGMSDAGSPDAGTADAGLADAG